MMAPKDNFAVLLAVILVSYFSIALEENVRIAEYNSRGHQWPPRDEEFIPNTEGWKTIFRRRFEQVNAIEDSNDRYNAYMSAVHQALLSKNFTENGWGLTKAPQVCKAFNIILLCTPWSTYAFLVNLNKLDDESNNLKTLVEELQKNLMNGLENQPKFEGTPACIETDNDPYFISQSDLNYRAMHELLPLHEAWSGVKLIPNNAYGLRVYRNNSSLNMHVDKSETHIISSILHVDHDKDSEPWPLVIEDFNGNTVEVFLEAGDMLFYESSKCSHGRPRKFQGSWYSSLFIHYYPEDWPKELKMDTHYRVPPSWNTHIKVDELENLPEKLIQVDTSMKEHGCEHEWCGLKNSIEVTGPAPGYGKVLSAGGIVTELQNIPSEESLLNESKERHRLEKEEL